MPNQKKFPTTTIIIIIIIIIISLVIGVLFWFWGQKTEGDMEKIIEEQYGEMEMRVAENIATIMENMVSGLTSQLEIISKIPTIRDADPENCNLALEQIYNTISPRIYNLARVNKNGIFACSMRKDILGQDATQYAHVAEVFKTQKSVIGRRFQGVNGEWLVAILVPVFTADGKFDGSLGGAINLGDLYENYFKENVFAQRGYVILVDDNGDYLYHPNPEIAVRNVHDEYMTKVLAESKELQDLVRNYLAGKTGITKYIYLKEWKLAAYTHAQITPDRFWPITITVPLNEIQGPIESVVLRLQYMSYAVVISLILLSCGIIISLLQWGKTQDIRIRARTQDLENANIAARNVLEDLQAEKEALTMAKAKDEALLASIGEGVVAVDESERIIAVSKATEKMLGWRFDEIKGKNLSDIIPIINEQGEFIPKEKRPMHLALSTSKIITTTTCFYVRKDGTRFPVAIAVAPIILEGKIIGAIDNFRDITKEKEIDKAKTEFVSLASHQLRTPLTSIKWYSDMLLEGDAGDLNPKQKKFVGKLYQGNERMVDLVRNLLNVSRIELGVLAVNPRPIDIGELFKEVIKEQAFAVQEKKHKVVVEIPEGLPKISTDSTLARMIWQNLFSNAIEYTPPKGKITCTAEKKDKEIIIAIKDTGIGIPQKQQNQVFQKLFRGNNAVREHSEGNGLGLYITKAMVEALSGKIWFKSKEGEGTTFYVSLPIKGPKIRSGQKIIGNSLWQN